MRKHNHYARNIYSMHRVKLVTYFAFICIVILLNSQHVQAKIQYELIATTVTITDSPSQAISSPTPALSSIPDSTPSITLTSTLLPLPAITLIFPAPTKTSTATITTVPAVITETPITTPSNEKSNLSPRYLLLEILLGFLWVFLIVFAVLFIRQLR